MRPLILFIVLSSVMTASCQKEQQPVKEELTININGIIEGKKAGCISQLISYVQAENQVSRQAKREILPSQPVLKRLFVGL